MIAIGDAIDVISGINSARDWPELLDRFKVLLSRYDWAGFSVSAFTDGGSVVAPMYHTDLCERWLRIYIERNYFADCPMTAHLIRSPHAITVEKAQAKAQTPRALEAVKVSRELGLSHGLLVPVHMRNGDKGKVAIGTWTALQRDEDILILQSAALVFHARFEMLFGRRQSQDPPLTERERDVLRWFAEGKQASDVADIIGIGTATVMFHYRQAQEKLGTLNRTHTVVEAMRRELLRAT
jgi:DNA-binding CsgD family transcriptional regulator